MKELLIMEKQHPTKTKQNKKGVFNNMTKKRNSIARLLLCAILTATMLLSMALPVMAEGGDDAGGLSTPKPYSEGTDAEHPAKAVFTKIFKMPINTTTPAATFTFTITKVSVNDKSDPVSDLPLMPNLGPVTVSFEAGQSQTFIDNGTKYLVDQTGNILAGLVESDWAAGAGKYKYTVKEETGGITLTTDTTDVEGTYYSGAAYDIEIWVEEDANGVLFPMYIVGYFNLTAGTQDEYYLGTPGDKKLDPTPGTTEPGEPGDIGKNYSDIIFTNRYWKTDGPTPPDLDPNKNALEIKKVVTGNNPTLDTLYDFTVTVTTPDAAVEFNTDGTPKTKTYNAYIVKDGDTTLPTTPIIFISGTAKTVSLKHGEKLVFFDLEVGAEVKVFEKVEDSFRVKYNNTFGPNDPVNKEFTMPVGADRPDNWGFPRNPEDKGPHYTKEIAGANISTFTNNVTGVPPTGITIDNLPYVIIIGLAVAGLVGFFVIKFRKNAKENIQ